MLDQPQEMAGAQDTIYLCNFRVSVDGEWLCLKQLEDVEFVDTNYQQPISPPSPIEPLALLGRFLSDTRPLEVSPEITGKPQPFLRVVSGSFL